MTKLHVLLLTFIADYKYFLKAANCMFCCCFKFNSVAGFKRSIANVDFTTFLKGDFMFFYVVLSSLWLNAMPLLVLSICLTCRFRVTVSALLSLVDPAHQLLLPLAAFKCDVF